MAKKLEPVDETTWNQYQAVRLLNFSGKYLIKKREIPFKICWIDFYRGGMKQFVFVFIFQALNNLYE